MRRREPESISISAVRRSDESGRASRAAMVISTGMSGCSTPIAPLAVTVPRPARAVKREICTMSPSSRSSAAMARQSRTARNVLQVGVCDVHCPGDARCRVQTRRGDINQGASLRAAIRLD